MIRALALVAALCAPTAWSAGIGVIDVEAVMAASNQAQQARQSWQQALAPIEQDIQQRIQQGQALELQFQRESDGAEKARLESQLNELRVQVLDLQQQAQTQLTQLENEFLAQQLPILESLVVQLAQENQLDLVVRADAVVWGDSSVNLSDDLLDRYNQP